jgi:hypothetical protein
MHAAGAYGAAGRRFAWTRDLARLPIDDVSIGVAARGMGVAEVDLRKK